MRHFGADCCFVTVIGLIINMDPDLFHRSMQNIPCQSTKHELALDLEDLKGDNRSQGDILQKHTYLKELKI